MLALYLNLWLAVSGQSACRIFNQADLDLGGYSTAVSMLERTLKSAETCTPSHSRLVVDIHEHYNIPSNKDRNRVSCSRCQLEPAIGGSNELTFHPSCSASALVTTFVASGSWYHPDLLAFSLTLGALDTIHLILKLGGVSNCSCSIAITYRSVNIFSIHTLHENW